MFPGRTNNDMLHLMIQCLGAMSNRLVRQHLMCVKTIGGGDSGGNNRLLRAHFGPNETLKGVFVFHRDEIDTVTQQGVVRSIPLLQNASINNDDTSNNSNKQGQQPKLIRYPSSQQQQQLPFRLLQAKTANDSRVEVMQLSNVMSKCLTLDPSRRIAVQDALGHPFFTNHSHKAAAAKSTATSQKTTTTTA